MCRLFGFRSVIASHVHRSVVNADNALCARSQQHPDGWGVAYYIDNTPHVMRSTMSALSDQIFHRVSGVVSSETVIAHIRRASHGPVSVLNCHPFQHGRWVLAHNGDINGFDEHRPRLIAEVAPRLRRFILGETDSEVFFFLFLTELGRGGPLSGRFAIDEAVDALRKTVVLVRGLSDGGGPGAQSELTVLVTDGSTLAAAQGGKELWWSTYKTRCGDRDSCPSLVPECEAPTESGFVNHLLLSSEELGGENVWNEMAPGDVIGVDWRMRLVRATLAPS